MSHTHATSSPSLAHSFAAPSAASGGALLASRAGVGARAGDRTEAGAASSSSFAAGSVLSAALRQSAESTISTTAPRLASAVRPSQVVDSTRAGRPKTRLQHLIRMRYYDPRVGRLTAQDPAGIRHDTNLYRYVRNRPLDLTDPTGEAATKSPRRQCRYKKCPVTKSQLSGSSQFCYDTGWSSSFHGDDDCYRQMESGYHVCFPKSDPDSCYMHEDYVNPCKKRDKCGKCDDCTRVVEHYEADVKGVQHYDEECTGLPPRFPPL